MSMQIASINSGSNGNCYYISNGNDAVLIDAGISCREIEKRITRLGADIKTIKGIFISHEHSDHITGVEVLSRKHKIPVYITPATHQHSKLKIEPELIQLFGVHTPVMAGGLTVTAFTKWHDAIDPHSFMVSAGNTHVGVLTDLGAPCEEVKKYFPMFHAVFLETNYDEDMLQKSSYPEVLKNRIRGKKGHLSNIQALELLKEYGSEHLRHVILSHLSKENNHPEKVKNLFEQYITDRYIEVAPRDKETRLFQVYAHFTPMEPPPAATAQMKLF